MGDLAVRCYEDGGALPLGDVERNEKVSNLRITFTPKPTTLSVILEILEILIQNSKRQLSLNYLYFKTDDVLSNPQNPVNPDSKPGVRSKF